MAGYSGTPLLRKLGIKGGMTILLVSPPDDYADTLGTLPDGVRHARSARGPVPFVQLFARSRRELERRFARLARTLTPAGMLWVSWPRKSSGVPSDLTEDVVRAVGLAAGLVDVKVCAVDDTWSGLKFVRRLRDRG